MHGFMDGYTRWISEENDDDVDVHMAGNNDMAAGLEEEMTDRHEDDDTGHGGREESGHGGGG